MAGIVLIMAILGWGIFAFAHYRWMVTINVAAKYHQRIRELEQDASGQPKKDS